MASSKRHIPAMPAYVTEKATPYWDMFTDSYNFEDVEAPRLAMLCNLYALAEQCQSMSFNKDSGKPLLIIPRRMMSGDPDDTQNIANPFIDELGGIHREIERISAGLGISSGEKVPVSRSSESPVERAARKKKEQDG